MFIYNLCLLKLLNIHQLVKESHIKSIIGIVREIIIINSLLLLKEHVIQIIKVIIHIVTAHLTMIVWIIHLILLNQTVVKVMVDILIIQSTIIINTILIIAIKTMKVKIIQNSNVND